MTAFAAICVSLFSCDGFCGLCVSRHLNESLDEFSPDLVMYIAGTAVLCTDESGGLSLSPQVV